MIGRVCKTGRSRTHELVVVPFRETRGGSFDCAVIYAPEGSRYPVGGYHISVPKDQLTALELLPGERVGEWWLG